MTITITQNPVFGQLYIEHSDDPKKNLRIPTTRISQFAEDGGLGEDEMNALANGGCISASGNWALALWELAEFYED